MATTNIKQDWQKIWQPTVGEIMVLKQQTNQNHSPPPSTNQKIVCIEQIVARPYVLCNLALAPLILVNYSVLFYFLVHYCGHVLTMTTPTNITSGIQFLILGSQKVAAIRNSEVTVNQRQDLYSPDVV